MLSKNFMIVSLVCSVVSVFFSVVALISVNKGKEVIHDLYWGYAHAKTSGIDSDLYIGVYGLSVYQSNNDEEYSTRLAYDSDSCTVTFCRTCHKYMPVVVGFLAAFIVMALITLFHDFSRFFGTGNTPANQMVGMSASLFAILLGLISLIVFAATCMKKVKQYINDFAPNTFDFSYGSAFGLLAVSVCLMFIDLVFNGLVGTGEAANGGPSYGQVNSNNANPAATPATAAQPITAAAPGAGEENKEVAMVSQA